MGDNEVSKLGAEESGERVQSLDNAIDCRWRSNNMLGRRI